MVKGIRHTSPNIRAALKRSSAKRRARLNGMAGDADYFARQNAEPFTDMADRAWGELLRPIEGAGVRNKVLGSLGNLRRFIAVIGDLR